jgi:hypothetical protein
MRHFHRPAAFDLALNLFSSFGYFEDVAEALSDPVAVPRLAQAWRQVLLDMVGKEPLARTFQPRTWHWHVEQAEYLLEERIVCEG